MAAFFGNSSFNVRERNSVAITLNIHTKSHTVRGRPTLKPVERFGNGSVRELYERSIYERSFTSELSIEKYQTKPAISMRYLILCLHVNTIVYLDVIENPVEYQKLLWNVSEERQKTEGIVYERIRPSIPKSSCLNKSQTHVSNYYKFQLSSDIEKNPGPTPNVHWP